MEQNSSCRDSVRNVMLVSACVQRPLSRPSSLAHLKRPLQLLQGTVVAMVARVQLGGQEHVVIQGRLLPPFLQGFPWRIRKSKRGRVGADTGKKLPL